MYWHHPGGGRQGSVASLGLEMGWEGFHSCVLGNLVLR